MLKKLNDTLKTTDFVLFPIIKTSLPLKPGRVYITGKVQVTLSN